MEKNEVMLKGQGREIYILGFVDMLEEIKA